MTIHHDRLISLLSRKDRAWRTFMARTMKLAAIADPRTGGNEMLIHNWGNDAARAVWADGWKRWHAYSASCELKSRALMTAHIHCL